MAYDTDLSYKAFEEIEEALDAIEVAERFVANRVEIAPELMAARWEALRTWAGIWQYKRLVGMARLCALIDGRVEIV